MKSFLDYVKLSDKLYEELYRKNRIFREVERKERQIYNHLLKVLIYNDSENNENVLKEIETWLLDIQSMNSKSPWLTKDVFLNILYDNIEEDFDFIAEKKKLDYNYGSLERSMLSPNEVKIRLDKIYDRICRELSTKSFKEIRSYPELKDRF